MKHLLQNLLNTIDIIPSEVQCSETLLLKVGYPLSDLGDYADYEWLWRVALLHELDFISDNDLCLEAAFDNPLFPSVTREELYARAYIIGKYAKTLQELDIFDTLILSSLQSAITINENEYFTTTLEQMIISGGRVSNINSTTNLFIIFCGDYICGDVLFSFSKELHSSFINLGHPCLLVDFENTIGIPVKNSISLAKLYLLAALNSEAVIGFQTTIFCEEISNNVFIGNIFESPKFQFIFDHPLYICYYLMQPIDNMYVLSLDDDYTDYINNYFDNIKRAYTLPPAGSIHTKSNNSKYEYDLCFIGKYYDYRAKLDEINELPFEKKMLASNLFDYLKAHPNCPVEKAFEIIANNQGIFKSQMTNTEWIATLHQIRSADTAIKFYYRELIIKTILDANIELHVFSNEWQQSPFADYDNLKIHPSVGYYDSLEIMSKTKISLNIMSWHKSGMTERIANAMLNNSVCLSDTSNYLENHFEDNENIVLFNLDELDKLPTKISQLLSSDESIISIVSAQKTIASNEHTWENRAIQLLHIIASIKKKSD